MIALTLVFGCGDQAPRESSLGSVATESQALISTADLKIPEVITLGNAVLAATNTLVIGSSARVIGVLSNTGTGATTIGTNATTGPIYSTGPVQVLSNAVITGDIRSASTITTQTGAVVTGARVASTPIALRTRRLSLDFLGGSNTTVNSGQTITRAAGQHGTITVNTGGTLKLTGGDYYLTALSVNAGGTLSFDVSNGKPVNVYVKGNLVLRGTVAPTAGQTKNILIAALGTTAIVLDSSFSGALVAPNTKVTVQTTNEFKGQVFAKDVELSAQKRATLRPIDRWDTVLLPLTAQNSTTGQATPLSSLLPNNAVGTAIVNYINAGYLSTDTADMHYTLGEINRQPAAQVAAALANAYHANPNPVMQRAVVDVAADVTKPENLPLFQEILSPTSVPSIHMVSSVTGHDWRPVAYGKIGIAAVRGASYLSGTVPAARQLLLDTATQHPVRALRRMAVIQILETQNPSLRADLEARMPAADRPWLTITRATPAQLDAIKAQMPPPPPGSGLPKTRPQDVGGVGGAAPVSPDGGFAGGTSGGPCTESTAVDLGAPGTDVRVWNNGCVRVKNGYPTWWTTLNMRLENTDGGTYPVPFAWTNTCSGSSGSGTFTANWQAHMLVTTSKNCATIIDLKGAGNGTIGLRYFGP